MQVNVNYLSNNLTQKDTKMNFFKSCYDNITKASTSSAFQPVDSSPVPSKTTATIEPPKLPIFHKRPSFSMTTPTGQPQKREQNPNKRSIFNKASDKTKYHTVKSELFNKLTRTPKMGNISQNRSWRSAENIAKETQSSVPRRGSFR